MGDDAKQQPLVLVVDDDTEVRSILTQTLSPRGYRVTTARDGEEGLEAVRREVPRLIILDYWMPRLDGSGFMRGLGTLLERRPPVILFTAYHDQQRLARELAVDVYVEKPIELRHIVKLCEATIRASAPVAVLPRAEGPERRAGRRFPLRRPVSVRVVGSSFSSAFTFDLSVGGMGLEMNRPIPAGCYVEVLVTLPDGRRFDLDARVRYTAPTGRCGIEFLALDPSRRAGIDALIAEARAA